MYGLPANFDTSIFLGKTLQQVCFSPNNIHFAFDGGLSVTIEGTFSHQRVSDKNDPEPTSVPVMDSQLMRLTGKTIVVAKVEEGGTLSLQFQDGQILRCLDDSPQYESYRITYGTRETIV